MGAANTGSVQLYYETITWGDKYSKGTHPTCMSGALVRIIYPREVRPEQMSSVIISNKADLFFLQQMLKEE